MPDQDKSARFKEITHALILVARNATDIALMADKDSFQYDLDSKARREDMRSEIEIAIEQLGFVKKALAELGVKFSE